jgi:hypothetical protein
MECCAAFDSHLPLIRGMSSTKQDFCAHFLPTSAQLQFRFSTRAYSLSTRLGVGVGLTRTL